MSKIFAEDWLRGHFEYKTRSIRWSTNTQAPFSPKRLRIDIDYNRMVILDRGPGFGVSLHRDLAHAISNALAGVLLFLPYLPWASHPGVVVCNTIFAPSAHVPGALISLEFGAQTEAIQFEHVGLPPYLMDAPFNWPAWAVPSVKPSEADDPFAGEWVVPWL